MKLGAAYGTTKGWGSSEAEHAYGRAQQLSADPGETPELFQAIRGLVTFYASRAELDIALDLGTRLLQIAESSGQAAQQLIANHQVGLVHCFRGSQELALAHSRTALALARPEQHRELASVYGAEPAVLVRCWSSWPLWITGHPDEALERCQEALRLAEDSGHLHSLVHALASTALVHLWRREWDAGREMTEQSIPVCIEHDFASIQWGCTVTRSLCRIHRGAEPNEIEEALADFGLAVRSLAQLSGNQTLRPLMLGMLAEALLRVGRDEQARTLLDAALGASREGHVGLWDAELHRLHAALLSGTAETEAALRRALDVASRQGARMLELRAAADLFALDRSDASRATLVDVVERFDDGGTAPELLEARALLASA